MVNNNLINLIEGINHISLNHEDLMDSVLGFSNLYSKNNPEHSEIIDKFFSNGMFIEQSLMAAREGVVLAMNAITLEEKINFQDIIAGCINLENQRKVESEVCADEKIREIMKKFLAELRKELFSRLYSQNKDFDRVTKIDKSILKQRYNQFLAEKF